MVLDCFGAVFSLPSQSEFEFMPFKLCSSKLRALDSMYLDVVANQPLVSPAPLLQSVVLL
jgi:hypothetical protein